jgi:alanine-synthesizing transaminase
MVDRRVFAQAAKLDGVAYEIRGRALIEASRLEAAGHEILKLNTGNPAIFGFEVPEAILAELTRTLGSTHGYSESRGILAAREAVVERYAAMPGFPDFGVEDVYLGNGVSELIQMVLQALLDPGDEVLIPTPDYPLWTAATKISGGTAVHYLCEEENGWQPSLEDIRAKITPATKALVIINPNNPTGAVYSREVLEGMVQLAREHSLLLLSDEIYDRILYDDEQHVPVATLAPDLLCLTFNGMSKTYRVAGYRSGWMVVTGPKDHAHGFLDGITLLASTRLCSSVPSQQALVAALRGPQSIDQLVAPGGRFLIQRDAAWEGLNAIPGVSCVKPKGALYAFPKLDPEVHEIRDDGKLVYDLLVAEHILLVQGTGFNWPTPDHLRVVCLPEPAVISEAIQRLGNFLSSYRQ